MSAERGQTGIERAEPGAVRVRRALLSVSEKAGVVDFARGLIELGVEIVSTGGTARALADAGLGVRAIEDFTDPDDDRTAIKHAKRLSCLRRRSSRERGFAAGAS